MHSLGNPIPPGIAPDSSGVTTLFLFDYGCAEGPGDDSVFRAIRTCLDRSAGVCALNDTGLLSAKNLAEFTNNAVATKTVDGGVVGSRQYRSLTSSAAALWTDHPENVELFHHYLDVHVVPRYQGAVLLNESASYEDFLRFCLRWSPASAAGRPGVLQKFVAAGLGMLENLAGWWLGIFGQARKHLADRRMLYLEATIGVLLLMVSLFFMMGRGPRVVRVDEQTAKQEKDTGVKLPSVDEFPRALPAGKNERLLKSGPGTMLGETEETGREEVSIGVLPKSAGVVPKVTKPVSAPPQAESGRSATPVSHKGLFAVQVGSFRQASRADLLAKQLGSKGYRASVSTVKLPDGRTMHRVRVGAFEARSEARAFGEQLKRRETFIASFFVAAKE